MQSLPECGPRPCCLVDQASDSNWCRLSADITQYNGAVYLSIIDCGPSRFAIWRKIRHEDAASIVAELRQLFLERGPPNELLMDHGTAFRSVAVRNLLERWDIVPVYRCAYRPAGNGLVERNHRTIKRMAARSNADPLDLVYWYNQTHKKGTDATTIPACIFTYGPKRHSRKPVKTNDGDIKVGDSVFVKPPDSRCTSV
jgi:transposase InsO family protein